MYITETIVYRKNFWCKFVIMDDSFAFCLGKCYYGVEMPSRKLGHKLLQCLSEVLGINIVDNGSF